MVQERLRFGIMCDDQSLQAWQYECIRKIIESNYGSLELIIKHDSSSGKEHKKATSKSHKAIKKVKLFLWKMALTRTKSQRRISLNDFFEKVPVINCQVRNEGKYSQFFFTDDIIKIKSYNLDFILRFGFNIIRGGILSSAKYGIWSFHHDDEMKYRGGPPCFWEIYNGDPVTGVILQILTDVLDGGIVLKKGFFKTIDYSYRKAIDQSYMESSNWPAYVCKYILNGSLDISQLSPSQTKAPIYRPPTMAQLWRFGLRLLKNKMVRLIDGLTQQPKWNIGIVNENIGNILLNNKNIDISWFKEGKKHHFVADPFALKLNGNLYLFFEDNGYSKYNGQIHCIKIRNEFEQEQAIDDSLCILKGAHHLSYPYVFQHDGRIFLTPECHQSRKIAIYSAEAFPHAWIEEKNLVEDFSGIDPTVFYHDGYWWLFATDGEGWANVKLYAWYAKDLLGDWKEHKKNPVKIDIRSSRPAGTPFIHDGELYRPSQNSSETYGGKLVINKVLRLSPEEFEEITIKELDGHEPYSHGIHTLAGGEEITLVDGKRYVFNLFYWVERMITFLKFKRYD